MIGHVIGGHDYMGVAPVYAGFNKNWRQKTARPRIRAPKDRVPFSGKSEQASKTHADVGRSRSADMGRVLLIMCLGVADG